MKLCTANTSQEAGFSHFNIFKFHVCHWVRDHLTGEIMQVFVQGVCSVQCSLKPIHCLKRHPMAQSIPLHKKLKPLMQQNRLPWLLCGNIQYRSYFDNYGCSSSSCRLTFTLLKILPILHTKQALLPSVYSNWNFQQLIFPNCNKSHWSLKNK